MSDSRLSAGSADWCIFANLGSYFPEIQVLEIGSWGYGGADTLSEKFDSNKDLNEVAADGSDLLADALKLAMAAADGDVDFGAKPKPIPKPLPVIAIAPALHLYA